MSETLKYLLGEDRVPKSWYNIVADLPGPPPPVLHPGTKEPIGPDDLAPLFPMALIGQEVSADREIEIPDPVRDVYRQWRPTPLHRARRLEQALDTPAMSTASGGRRRCTGRGVWSRRSIRRPRSTTSTKA